MPQTTNRVLHVITTISRGGAENHLVELIRNQIEQGSKVGVAYLKGDGYWRATLESFGVRVVNLEMRAYGEIGPVIRLRSLIRDFSPNLVHAHLPPAELYARLSLLGISGARLPLVITKHNDERFYKGIGERMVGRWVARRAKHVIAISDAVRDFMVGQQGVGIALEKVGTIHYGILAEPYESADPAEIRKLRISWGAGDDGFLIGTVARFVPQKALHVLLKGFALYLANSVRSPKLVLIGSGPLESELRRLSEELGLKGCVVWAGFREDIPVVMNALDVFALTSVHEGFGLVLLEAMAAGRPVVASSVSAIPEIVSDLATGILIPSGSAESLAAAFKSLEDDEYRCRLGRAGRLRVETEFTVQRMVKDTDKVYKTCRTERG